MSFKSRLLKICVLVSTVLGVCTFSGHVYANKKTINQKIARIDKAVDELKNEKAKNPVAGCDYSSMFEYLDLKKRILEREQKEADLKAKMSDNDINQKIARIDKAVDELKNEKAKNPVAGRDYSNLFEYLDLKKRILECEQKEADLKAKMSDNDRQICDDIRDLSLVSRGLFEPGFLSDFFGFDEDRGMSLLGNPFKMFDDFDKSLSTMRNNIKRLLPAAETSLVKSEEPKSIVNLKQLGKPGIVVLDGTNKLIVDQGLDKAAIEQLKNDVDKKGLEAAVNKFLKNSGYSRKLKDLKKGYTVAVCAGNNQFFSCSRRTGDDGKSSFCSNSWSCSSFSGDKNKLN